MTAVLPLRAVRSASCSSGGSRTPLPTSRRARSCRPPAPYACTSSPGLAPIQVARLRTEDIDRLYRELRKRGGQNGKPLAPATVKRAHVILHRALEQAVRWGWIRTNPAHQAQVPRIPAPDIHPPTPSELVHLFALAEESDPGFATFLLAAAATGRQTERAPGFALVRHRRSIASNDYLTGPGERAERPGG